MSIGLILALGAIVIGVALIITGIVSKRRAEKRLQAEYEAETAEQDDSSSL